jgi:hypothetical protein
MFFYTPKYLAAIMKKRGVAMRTVVAVMLAVTLLTLPADAAFEAKPSWRLEESEGMTCIPFKLDKETDPVIRTYVSAEFNADTGEIKSLSVIHEVMSGNKYDRSDQYTQAELRQKEPHKALWIWSGIRKSNRRQTMVGELHRGNDNRWYYDEYIYLHGDLTYHYASKCSPYEFERQIQR